MVDVLTSLYAGIAILAALRHRDQVSGEGQHIDLSLLDCGVASLSHFAMNYLVSGEVPPRRGNGGYGGVPSQAFRCSDRSIFVVAGNDKQFAALCRALGCRVAARGRSLRHHCRRGSPTATSLLRAARRGVQDRPAAVLARPARCRRCADRPGQRTARRVRRPADAAPPHAGRDRPPGGRRDQAARATRSGCRRRRSPTTRRRRCSASTRAKCSAACSALTTRSSMRSRRSRVI